MATQLERIAKLESRLSDRESDIRELRDNERATSADLSKALARIADLESSVKFSKTVLRWLFTIVGGGGGVLFANWLSSLKPPGIHGP